MDAGSL